MSLRVNRVNDCHNNLVSRHTDVEWNLRNAIGKWSSRSIVELEGANNRQHLIVGDREAVAIGEISAECRIDNQHFAGIEFKRLGSLPLALIEEKCVTIMQEGPGSWVEGQLNFRTADHFKHEYLTAVVDRKRITIENIPSDGIVFIYRRRFLRDDAKTSQSAAIDQRVQEAAFNDLCARTCVERWLGAVVRRTAERNSRIGFELIEDVLAVVGECIAARSSTSNTKTQFGKLIGQGTKSHRIEVNSVIRSTRSCRV